MPVRKKSFSKADSMEKIYTIVLRAIIFPEQFPATFNQQIVQWLIDFGLNLRKYDKIVFFLVMIFFSKELFLLQILIKLHKKFDILSSKISYDGEASLFFV